MVDRDEECFCDCKGCPRSERGDEVVDKYVDKAKQLKRDCYHSAGCEVCHNEASDICNVLCEFDNKTLAELEDNTIANYLRMIEDANNKRKI